MYTNSHNSGDGAGPAAAGPIISLKKKKKKKNTFRTMTQQRLKSLINFQKTQKWSWLYSKKSGKNVSASTPDKTDDGVDAETFLPDFLE